jgi:hypothetical protein
MFEHRPIQPRQLSITSFSQPFSSFDHIDSHYQDNNPAIRRLFSLARAQDAHTLVTEEIDPAGVITDENAEIAQYCNDYQMTGLNRVSFWKSDFSSIGSDTLREEDCLGYAILKRDQSVTRNYHRWHVFEAVLKKYDHKHNCVPNPGKYEVTIGNGRDIFSGLLFAQQNGLNKCCSQVALRSVISRIRNADISYSETNNFAQASSLTGYDPANGLTTTQIRAVLKKVLKSPFVILTKNKALKVTGNDNHIPNLFIQVLNPVLGLCLASG